MCAYKHTYIHVFHNVCNTHRQCRPLAYSASEAKLSCLLPPLPHPSRLTTSGHRPSDLAANLRKTCCPLPFAVPRVRRPPTPTDRRREAGSARVEPRGLRARPKRGWIAVVILLPPQWRLLLAARGGPPERQVREVVARLLD